MTWLGGNVENPEPSSRSLFTAETQRAQRLAEEPRQSSTQALRNSASFAPLLAAHTVRVLPVKVRPQEMVMSLCSHTRRFMEATLGGESSKVKVLVGVGQAIRRAAA